MPLWIPVLVGLGASVYLALPAEPSAILPIVVLAGLGAMGWVGRANPWTLLLAAFLGCIALGFGAATLRAHLVATPVLAKRLASTQVEGRLLAVESRPGNVVRLTLGNPVIAAATPASTPRRVRITLRQGDASSAPLLAAGMRVRLRATLMPPPPPAVPGAYDFGRDLWFQGIGATGFGFGRVEVLDGGGRDGTFASWLMGVRQGLAERIAAPLPQSEGAIAAALIVGLRGEVPREVESAWRDSGLAHILSISGLHVSLAAGLIFALIRGGLALIPSVALRHPIKKWAAGAALATALVYLFLSGADTPVQRSVLMAGLALTGVMLDRPAISLRLVAWAALTILLLFPESVANASFQMSFAAVVALIAGFEVLAEPLRRLRGERPGLARRASHYFLGIALSTILASIATLPFGLYHFNRAVNYALLANMIGVPITGLVVMPAAILGLVAMPFGLEAWPLRLMGWGISVVDAIAHWVAQLPGAVTSTGAIPVAALAFAVLGGLWLCLWRQPWRLGGLAFLVMALAWAGTSRPPNLIVDGDARLVLINDGTGVWLSGSARSLSAETWLRRAGHTNAADFPPDGSGASAGGIACDALGCVWRPVSSARMTVVVSRRPEGLAEDCRAASVLVSLEPVRRRCSGPQMVVDRFDLWRKGTHALWFGEDGSVRVETVADQRGARPWVPVRDTAKPRTTPERRRKNQDKNLSAEAEITYPTDD